MPSQLHKIVVVDTNNYADNWTPARKRIATETKRLRDLRSYVLKRKKIDFSQDPQSIIESLNWVNPPEGPDDELSFVISLIKK